jgi:hypothetical protein
VMRSRQGPTPGFQRQRSDDTAPRQVQPQGIQLKPVIPVSREQGSKRWKKDGWSLDRTAGRCTSLAKEAQ